MNPRERRPSATQVRTILQNGMIIGIDDSVWIYRQVPMDTVADARTSEDRTAAATPLYRALSEVSKLVPGSVGRRSVAKSNYRNVHLLAVNIPALFMPDSRQNLRDKHAEMYPDVVTSKRVCLFGVRLIDSIGKSGSSVKETINTVAEVLLSGSVPLEDFAADHRRIDHILARCGLATPDPETLRLANGWWNYGSAPDIPVLPSPETLHFFTSSESAQVVEEIGLNNRAEWPESMPGHHSVTFTTLADLEFNYDDSSSDASLWVSQMYDNNAAVVSIRGFVEPRKITQKEIRKRRRTYLADIEERVKNNKMNRAEQDERFQELGQIEQIYADDGTPPTMIETSVVAGFDGEVGDPKELTDDSAAVLHIMQNRQYEAWAETMIASGVRANPHIHDIPTHVIACSGINSLSIVGDDTGAIVGFTERDSQPSYIDPSAASEEDSLPIMLVAAGTGSGKLAVLSTPIPTPDGWTRMGDLEVGDWVLGRSGKPTRVTFLSEVDETPDLYTVTFSDGQKVTVDFDHQWVVSSHAQRNKFKDVDRQTAIANWRKAHEDADELDKTGRSYGVSDEATISELLELVQSLPLHDQRWTSYLGIYSALHMMDAPFRTGHRKVTARRFTEGGETVKTDPSKLFDLHAGLGVLFDRWKDIDPRTAPRWGEQAQARAKAVRAVMEREDTRLVTSSQAIDLLEAEAASLPKKTWRSTLLKKVRDAGVEVVDGFAEVRVPMPESHTREREVSLYPLRSTLLLLAERLRQQYAKEPKNSYDERRMTTGEILAASEGKPQKHAVHVAEAINLPESEVPVDPYTLGAWLGDGYTDGAAIVSEDREIIDNIEASGYKVSTIRVNHERQTSETHIYRFGPDLRDDLASLGFTRRKGRMKLKHIPYAYLRSSVDQRLALLQGLMDTDGTIDTEGACELSLSDQRLAADALELVRSLGIKASMRTGRAGYTDDADEYVQCKDRHRIHFTTTQPVFRLPRKAARLPVSTRDSSEWIYIDSIEPAPTEPGRCITVEDPDATYLIEGFIPTSNTMLALHLADQFVDGGNPVIFVDPKTGSDHSRAVLSTGKGHIFRLDDLAQADGIFDPIGFSADSSVGVQLAVTMLRQVDPWSGLGEQYETRLTTALAHGVNRGARCIGQALKIALDDGRLENEVAQPIFELAEASTTFRACVGMNPSGERLRVSAGINLIMVGDYSLDLPAPGQPPESQQQRVAMALVRMMVFGSAMALTNRNGVIFLDEAWIFLQSGPSEVIKLGRLARSQRVFPVLLTQRVSDALGAGLEDFISRMLIGAIENAYEAHAASQMAKLDGSNERISRITAPATIGQAGKKVPNFASMKALRNKDTRETYRGAIYIYSDLAKRAVPVEVKIPAEFLQIASTNAIDINLQRAKEGLPPLELATDSESDEA
jgi:hypothetical protein